MQTPHLLVRFSIFVLLIAISSCSRSDGGPSKEQLLTAGEWTGAVVYVEGQIISQRLIDQIGYDIREESLLYKPDGTFTVHYRGLFAEGNWDLNAQKNVIFHNRGTNRESKVQIQELTKTQLSVTRSVNSNVGPVLLEVMYIHK